MDELVMGDGEGRLSISAGCSILRLWQKIRFNYWVFVNYRNVLFINQTFQTCFWWTNEQQAPKRTRNKRFETFQTNWFLRNCYLLTSVAALFRCLSRFGFLIATRLSTSFCWKEDVFTIQPKISPREVETFACDPRFQAIALMPKATARW